MGFKVLGRTSYILCGAQCKMKTQGPLFRNYEELRDGHWRPLKQVQASSHKPGTLGNRTGHTHTKLA